MYNFETIWRKNHRLEGLIIYYEKQAKQDAFKIMQLQDIIKNLEIELTQAKAKTANLKSLQQKKTTVTKLKTTKKGK